MFKVTYLPSRSVPGWTEKEFTNVEEFEDWLNNSYFCEVCKDEIEEQIGPGPWVWKDMLSVCTGCSCEIDVETP